MGFILECVWGISSEFSEFQELEAAPGVAKTMIGEAGEKIKRGKELGRFFVTPPKFNSSPLKNHGWKTTFLLGFGNFSGAMLNFGRVFCLCVDGEKRELHLRMQMKIHEHTVFTP